MNDGKYLTGNDVTPELGLAWHTKGKSREQEDLKRKIQKLGNNDPGLAEELWSGNRRGGFDGKLKRYFWN
jgi:hypothetical protein